MDGLRYDGAHLWGWDERPPHGRGLAHIAHMVHEADPTAYQLAEYAHRNLGEVYL